MYRSLNPDEIVRHIDQLHHRIKERFPERNLQNVCAELLDVAKETRERARWIAQPNWGIRSLVGLLIIGVLVGLILAVQALTLPNAPISILDFIQVLEAGINDVVLIGAAIFFLMTIENRIKRHRTLDVLRELRALAHVIDMHQLTKDPQRTPNHQQDTPSSPKDMMEPFLLVRYLDYCSEMLSHIGKLAALYVQEFDDGIALTAVTEIEDLTTGLSRKIWQKIMIIHSTEGIPRTQAIEHVEESVPDSPPIVKKTDDPS